MEMPGIVSLTKALGIERIVFQSGISDWGKVEFARRIDALRIDLGQPSYDDVLRETARVAREKNITLEILPGSGFSRHHKCPWPWLSTFIAANGDVVPCCTIADSGIAKMGNVFEQPFERIWNSEAYQDLRECLRINSVPAYCRSCYDPQMGAQGRADRGREAVDSRQ